MSANKNLSFRQEYSAIDKEYQRELHQALSQPLEMFLEENFFKPHGSQQSSAEFLFEQSAPTKVFSPKKKAEFSISRFDVKNGVSSGHITNPLPPVKAKKVSSTQTSIIRKIISTMDMTSLFVSDLRSKWTCFFIAVC